MWTQCTTHTCGCVLVDTPLASHKVLYSLRRFSFLRHMKFLKSRMKTRKNIQNNLGLSLETQRKIQQGC